jgi:hypothetical protein
MSGTFLDAMRRAGGTCSDGPVPAGFDSGWGKHPFVGKSAHHWTVVAQEPEYTGLRSLCSLQTVATSKVPLLGAGNFEHCSRCDAALLLRSRSHVAREYPEWVKPVTSAGRR